jgi:tRNA threonylcarbamoyladenosine biosynthesis protein TsaE
MFTIILHSQDDTRNLARCIATRVAGAGDVIGLVGPLGVGKTFFVREFTAALGSPDPVSSPTFVLAQEYRCAENLLVLHWDLYRLGCAPDELLGATGDVESIALVEWIDRDEEYSSRADLLISFARNGTDDARLVQFSGRHAVLVRQTVGECGFKSVGAADDLS